MTEKEILDAMKDAIKELGQSIHEGPVRYSQIKNASDRLNTAHRILKKEWEVPAKDENTND